jgi:hypothetical protein
MGVVSDI